MEGQLVLMTNQEVWKGLGERAVDFLTKLYNTILYIEKILEECMKSVLVLVFKNKDDVQSSTMNIWERVLEVRLGEEMMIC